MKPLFLASQSPRRATLLSQLGLPFQILSPLIEETTVTGTTKKAITQQTEQNALMKARSVLEMVDKGVIISGDTVVVTKQYHVLGKPTTPQDALGMLKQLVGTLHHVLSAVAVISASPEKISTDHVWTKVAFRNIPLEGLTSYVATKEPLGKAGGYAIQGKGGFLVEHIEGSQSAVIGLPLELVVSLLNSHGIDVWQYWNDYSSGTKLDANR
jgi:septum formation protein